MDGENSWRGKSVSREKIAKFENEILLHKGQFIFILLRSLSPRVPSSSSKSSFFYALFFPFHIYLQSTVCADGSEKRDKWRKKQETEGKFTMKKRFRSLRVCPRKTALRLRLPHWMKHIRHDCCVFFVSWIYAQYIKLRSLESKMLDLSGGSVGGMKGEKAYKQAYISL